MLHDNRRAFEGLELLAQAHDPRHDPVGGPEIEHQDVILFVMNNLVKGGNQLRMPSPSEAALEDGELQPFSVTVPARA